MLPLMLAFDIGHEGILFQLGGVVSYPIMFPRSRAILETANNLVHASASQGHLIATWEYDHMC